MLMPNVQQPGNSPATPPASGAPDPSLIEDPTLGDEGEPAGGTGDPAVAPSNETDEEKNARVLREREAKQRRGNNGFTKRINEVTADKHRAEERADRMERLVEQLLGKVVGGTPGAPGTAAQEPPEPKREDYQDWESFNDARTEWKIAKKLAQARQDWEKEQTTRSQQTQATEVVQQATARIVQSGEALQAKVPDFAETVGQLDFDVPVAMLHAVADTDNPAAVLYVLGKQPDVARDLARQSPIRIARAIGAIEQGLRAAQARQSNAPTPPNPVGSRGAPADGPPEDPAAYAAWAAKKGL